MTIAPYQGQRLGLPAGGSGAVAPLGRRLLALLVDWVLCLLIAVGVFGMEWGEVSGTESMVPLSILFVEHAVLVGTVGATVGHRLLGIRVDTLDRGPVPTPPPLLRSVARAALLCLGVPALIMDADGRGLHDKAARSVVVRTR